MESPALEAAVVHVSVPPESAIRATRTEPVGLPGVPIEPVRPDHHDLAGRLDDGDAVVHLAGR